MLITELITWHDPEVREHSNDETFTEQEHLHRIDREPYRVLLKSLGHISKDCAVLFLQAWTSKVLEDCPSMDAWVTALTSAPDTLAIPKKSTEHVIRRVKKPRKDSARKIQQQDPTLIPRTYQAPTRTGGQVVGRRAVQPKGDQRQAAPSAVSKHVVRRVPASEIRSRRGSLLQDKKATSPSMPTSTPSVVQPAPSQVSWETVIVTLIIIVAIVLCCALVGHWLLQ
jgi:hypothetical protein